MTRTSANPCLTEEVLQHLLNGTLAATQDAHARKHLKDCEACRQKMECLLETLDQDIPALSAAKSADIQPWMGNILNDVADRHENISPDQTQSGITETIIFPDKSNDSRYCGRIDEFEIIEHIASGATGHLYRARDTRLDRTVAIKLLRAELCVSRVAKHRFLREANVIARLDSDFIVNVYDVRERSDFPPYLVMELIDGPSLQQEIEGGHRPTHAQSVKRICQVLDGLSAAHANSVIHRDVKPGNILLCQAPDERCKLVDFGLARLDEQSLDLTSPGSIAGTPAYMAPEQVLDAHDANEQSDVYSAGVVLYELLTAEVPFRGSVRMVLHQVLHVEPRQLRSLDDEIPRDLQTVCLKAMAKLPGQRYVSTTEFRDDLQRWLNGLPVLARPVGLVGRYLRWKTRSPTVANLALVIAGLFVTLLAMWGRFTFEATTARHELEIRNRDLRESSRLQQEANARTEAERAVAVREADRANRQANLAFRVLNRLTFGVQNALADRPVLQQTILDASISDLRGLSAEVDADSPVSLTLAVAYLRLGEASQKTGDSAAAHQCYQDAQEILDSMSLGFRQQPDILQCQVWLHLSRGEFAKAEGETALEYSELQSAISVCQQIEAISPGRVVTMHAQALASFRMVDCVDESDGARRLSDAISLLKQCVQLDESAEDIRFDLAAALLRQASLTEVSDVTAACSMTVDAIEQLLSITSHTPIRVQATETGIRAMAIVARNATRVGRSRDFAVLKQKLVMSVEGLFESQLIDSKRQADLIRQLRELTL